MVYQVYICVRIYVCGVNILHLCQEKYPIYIYIYIYIYILYIYANVYMLYIHYSDILGVNILLFQL